MIYDYECPECGTRKLDVFNRIDERETNAPLCCGERMRIIITQAPYGWADREVRYVCPATNERITTRRQRNENFARNGFIDANDIGWDQKKARAEKKKKQEELAAIDAEVPQRLKNIMSGEFEKQKKEFLHSR